MAVRRRGIMDGGAAADSGGLSQPKELPRPPDESARTSRALNATLRPAEPADEDSIEAFLRTVSPDRIFSRFQSKNPPEGHARDMACADGRHTVSILAYAVVGGRERLAGIGTYGTRGMPPSTADVGLLVHQDFQQRGLGGKLLGELASKARKNGLKRLEFMHAADNDGMRRTIASAQKTGLVDLEREANMYPGVKKVTVSIV